MHVYHVVLNDDDLENIKRWAEARNVTVEEWIQSAVDEQIEAELLFELRRILKFGGSLLFNAPWLPRVPGLELKEIWVSESIYPNNDCLLAVFTTYHIVKAVKGYRHSGKR